MAETQTAPSDFGLVWESIHSWLPTAYTAVYRAGLTGETARGTGKPLLASDLTHLLIPGLLALGVEADLIPLPLDGGSWKRHQNENNVRILFGFAAPLAFSPPEEINDATPLPGDTDPAITTQMLFPNAAIGNGPNEQNPEEAVVSLVRCTHVLLLNRFGTKALRRESVSATLYRWLAWHAAYPERAPREADLTDPACAPAAAFLSEVVGTRRDFASNRLRRAARCFEAAQIDAAYAWLLETSIALWQLPAATAEALLSAPEQPLSATLRQELIYLARAGTLPLKTLAARRLTHELHHPDARKTLHQLRFDATAWVRAAARPMAT